MHIAQAPRTVDAPHGARIAPLPVDLPAVATVPDSAKHRVPAAWNRAGAATLEYAPGAAPWRADGAETDSYALRTGTGGARASWVRMETPFDVALSAAAMLVADDTRDSGYGTAHGVFQAAEGGAYFIAPLTWTEQASMPDATVTFDADGYGDPIDLPASVTAGTPDLKAIVGLTSWADLRGE
jgi:hypothetical protein